MDRIAARVEAEIVAGDLPARAEFIEEAVGREAAPHQLAERLFDGILLRFEAGERQFRRECRGKAAHAAGDVERRGTGHRVRIARRQQQCRGDAHGAADPGGVETAQAGSRRGGRQQRHLPVLMRQRPRREPGGEPPGDIVAEQEGRQQLAAGAAGVLADRQDPGQNLHRRLARDQAQAFAQLDRAAGNAVQQRGGARIVGRPAARIDRGSHRRRSPPAARAIACTSGRSAPARMTPSVSSNTSFVCRCTGSGTSSHRVCATNSASFSISRPMALELALRTLQVEG